jgi:hypothetical protein
MEGPERLRRATELWQEGYRDQMQGELDREVRISFPIDSGLREGVMRGEGPGQPLDAAFGEGEGGWERLGM